MSLYNHVARQIQPHLVSAWPALLPAAPRWVSRWPPVPSIRDALPPVTVLAVASGKACALAQMKLKKLLSTVSGLAGRQQQH